MEQPNVEPEAAPRAGVVRARSILIIEDNEDARQMLGTTLALDGHRVHAARDGVRGLALAAEACLDIALIDIALPDIDGYEVARRLRAVGHSRRIELIAVTGFGKPEDQRRAKEAGFDAHVVKPVTPERLRELIAGLP